MYLFIYLTVPCSLQHRFNILVDYTPLLLNCGVQEMEYRLRRLLRVLWTTRRSTQSILKEICPQYSLEGLMLKLKL